MGGYSLAQTVKRTLNAYTIASIIIAAQGAILTFGHVFGSPQLDAVLGPILLVFGGLVTAFHAYLGTINVTVPPSVYNFLYGTQRFVVALMAAGGIITQYVGSVNPTLTVVVAVILQGGALFVSLFTATFQSKLSKAAVAGRPVSIAEALGLNG